MYRYDEFDQHFVEERVAQFRDQTQRYIDGTLSHADIEHRLAEALRQELGDHPVRVRMKAWMVSGTA